MIFMANILDSHPATPDQNVQNFLNNICDYAIYFRNEFYDEGVVCKLKGGFRNFHKDRKNLCDGTYASLERDGWRFRTNIDDMCKCKNSNY